MSVADAKRDLWECEREVGMAAGRVFFIHLQELQDSRHGVLWL
jgi:hypothetical protein